MTSLNAQGINKAEARILIEKYMDKHNIDFMFVQDTRIPHNQRETRKHIHGLQVEKPQCINKNLFQVE